MRNSSRLAALLAFAPALSSCESGIQFPTEDLWSKEYTNSVGFKLPSDTPTQTLQQRFDDAIEPYLSQAILALAAGGADISPIVEVVQEWAQSTREESRQSFYIKSETDNSWESVLTVCPQDHIFIATVYDDGTTQNIEEGISSGAFYPNRQPLRSGDGSPLVFPLLYPGEETEEAPNLFISKHPIDISTILTRDPTVLETDRSYILGLPNQRNATLIVRASCEGGGRFSHIPQGVYRGVNLERDHILQLGKDRQDWTDNDGSFYIAFDENGEPMDLNSRTQQWVVLQPGYSDSLGDLNFTVGSITKMNNLQISIEYDISGSGIRGFQKDDFTYNIDSDQLYMNSRVEQRSAYDNAILTSTTTGWGDRQP